MLDFLCPKSHSARVDSLYSLFRGRFHLHRTEIPPKAWCSLFVCSCLFSRSLPLSFSSVLDAFAISSERLWNLLCCSSLRIELEDHWTDLYEIRYLRILRMGHFNFCLDQVCLMMTLHEDLCASLRVFFLNIYVYLRGEYCEQKLYKMKQTFYHEYVFYANITFREIN
jgi:hypothetical protein